MLGKPAKLMREKDGFRGDVPAVEDAVLDTTYAAYLTRIGIEENPALQMTLATAADPKFKTFLKMLSATGRAKNIVKIAKLCGIDMLEFQNFFQSAAKQVAVADAQLKAMGIVSDMAEDARTKDEGCERCDGLGWVVADPAKLPSDTPGMYIVGMQTTQGSDEVKASETPIWGRTCPKCKGKSTVKIAGDEHSRDRILEIAGLVSRGGKNQGASVVVNFGGAAHQSAVTGALSALTIDVDAETIDNDGEIVQ